LTTQIGPIVYDKPLPWRVRLAFWIAPELRDELAHFGREAQRLGNWLEVQRDV
jgi:hypothetical protein